MGTHVDDLIGNASTESELYEIETAIKGSVELEKCRKPQKILLI